MNPVADDAAALIARVQPLTRTRVIRGPFDYRLRADQDPVGVGSLLRVPFGNSTTMGVVVELAGDSELEPERLAEPLAVLPGALPPDLVGLASWMASEYCSTPARALQLLLPPGAGKRPRRRRAGQVQPDVTGTSELGVRTAGLTAAQREALAAVLAALRVRAHPTNGGGFLLHGVTGSGKTEVYLRAVDAALQAGRSAIVLVPEIALTPQTLARFRSRFGELVAVLHSALADGERRAEWLRLRSGKARVCVGPRSAVFAPLRDIGLIVVDEEHDPSYKHEGDPRYDARAVALRRAQDHRAVLLAGSATPRPESMVTLRRLRLRSRVDRRPLPAVEVLDMRGAHHPLHPRTREALVHTRRTSGKALVLLNRRGWSNFLCCRACGQAAMCPNCDVALVLHRSHGQQPSGAGRGVLACHHCGHRERAPERCGACRSVALARHGAGTERLEHDLRDALGDREFPVFRLDADASARKGELARVLAEFRAAEAGVLVGTQIIAKGHDFPDIGLGVVLDADATLRFPDFRAEERTFALITQLAGRAGRGGAGRVLVQTLAPRARPIVFAAEHDADGFLSGELPRRESLGYPPYGSLIRVVCSSLEAADAHALAGALGAEVASAGVSVLGPAPLFRLRGRARSQLVVKSAAREKAIQAVAAAIDRHAASASRKSVSVGVDVDPQ
ncbi:MAG TPA: primosomal protein N' [Solirubrobacteraceae bacterium]